jgi:hypothetical protein
VLVIYMVTVYSAYVPDWSYVYHLEGDIDDGKLFTVLGAYLKDVSSLLIIFVNDTVLVFIGTMWCKGPRRPSLQCSRLC